MRVFFKNHGLFFVLLFAVSGGFSRRAGSSLSTGVEEPPPLRERAALSMESVHPDPETRRPPVVGEVPSDMMERIFSEEADPVPFIGDVSGVSAEYRRGGDPLGHVPEELIERIRSEPNRKDSFKKMKEMDVLIAGQRSHPEMQTVISHLEKALKTEDSGYYRVLIKYILQSYSPVQVLSIIHFAGLSGGETLLHKMARVRSPEMIYELRSQLAAFLPFERKNNHFGLVRDVLVPKEFREEAAPDGETGRGGNLWEMDSPVSLKNSPLTQALMQTARGESPPESYLWIRDAILKEPGAMRYLLALVYGNTVTGESLYDYYDRVMEVESLDPEVKRILSEEKNNQLRIWTLPLYKPNKKGLTPRRIAEKAFRWGGAGAVYSAFARAEEFLGIETGRKSKGRGTITGWLKGKQTAAFLPAVVSCLSLFQTAE